MRINRIKFATELLKRDMTQKKLSELSGVSRMTINSIKSGKSCSDEVGKKIAKVLQIPVETLLED